MYIKLNEDERAMLNKVQEATWTNYEIEGNYIKADNLLVALKDMLVEYHKLEEKFEDYKTNYDEEDPHDIWWEQQQGLR